MQKVTGIGGWFFRYQDPKALAVWHATHLDIAEVSASCDAKVWQQQAGVTVLAPFKADSADFGDAAKNGMINFRADDLDARVVQRRGAVIDVGADAETYPKGRFAGLADPQGNPVRLWHPMTSESAL